MSLELVMQEAISPRRLGSELIYLGHYIFTVRYLGTFGYIVEKDINLSKYKYPKQKLSICFPNKVI